MTETTKPTENGNPGFKPSVEFYSDFNLYDKFIPKDDEDGHGSIDSIEADFKQFYFLYKKNKTKKGKSNSADAKEDNFDELEPEFESKDKHKKEREKQQPESD